MLMRRHHDVISEAPRELGEGVISDSANIGRYRWLGIHKGARPPRRSAMGRRTKGDNFDCWEWMGKEILIYRRRVYPDSCVIPPYKVLRSLPSSRGAVHFLLGNSCRFSKYAHRYSQRKSDAACDESAEVAILQGCAPIAPSSMSSAYAFRLISSASPGISREDSSRVSDGRICRPSSPHAGNHLPILEPPPRLPKWPHRRALSLRPWRRSPDFSISRALPVSRSAMCS